MKKINNRQIILAACASIFAIGSASAFGAAPCAMLKNSPTACESDVLCQWHDSMPHCTMVLLDAQSKPIVPCKTFTTQSECYQDATHTAKCFWSGSIDDGSCGPRIF